MLEAKHQSIKRGDMVRLISKPDGHLSQHCSLTVGNLYKVEGFMGTNIITDSDVPGETASYWLGRVEKI